MCSVSAHVSGSVFRNELRKRAAQSSMFRVGQGLPGRDGGSGRENRGRSQHPKSDEVINLDLSRSLRFCYIDGRLNSEPYLRAEDGRRELMLTRLVPVSINFQ